MNLYSGTGRKITINKKKRKKEKLSGDIFRISNDNTNN